MYSCSLNNYNKYNPSFGKTAPLKIYGEVSKSFVNEMKTGIKQYPREITSKIIKAELLDDIRLAPKASDAFPEYPKTQKYYRSTFIPEANYIVDDVVTGVSTIISSLFANKKSIIGLFESPRLAPKEITNRGAVAHELTHKADSILKKIIGINISQTESFKEAVRNDLTNFSEKSKLHPKLIKKWPQHEIDYTIQKSVPENLVPYGLKEIFAECGAANTTGTTTEIRKKVKIMNVFFPESYKYVQKYLYLMGMR